MDSKKHIYLILLGTILTFGIGWPVSKMGLEYMPPITFSASRLVIATLFMFIVVIVLRQFIWPTRKDLPIILSIGLLQIGLFILCINLGLQTNETGRSTILVYTTPIWVTPIAVFFFKESAGLLKWLGLILGMSGVIILFGPKSIDWNSAEHLFHNLVLLIAAISWAISILCARYMKWEHSALSLFPWQLLIGTLPMVLLMLFELPHETITWNATLIGALLFTGLFAQALGALGIIVVSKVLPSMTTSLCLLSVPVISIISAKILLDEPITLLNTIAMILIMLGLLCTLFGQRGSNGTK